ncbi:DUF4238 domain-containing protein [Arthrobacter bambusae]|uniref:DUF4238 domain-containing protein n=1 Tax=Arthrobacter bambusae TaxID=1338426 RepID=UPI0027878405|nr:DUF4238 domain-containing protein [Arthrobacter bambusae]MDQ0242005.1 hypothetical protein [Arthrobacter bambusae]
MERDHFIPATYMAGLSHVSEGARRDRKLWAMRRDGREPYPTRAAAIGYIKGFYSLRSDDPNSRIVDDIWKRYEESLHFAIDELADASKPLSANTWLRTLVPFVASLFVRGRDFADRYKHRVNPALHQFLNKEQINRARLLDLQRLLAPVTAARWVVLHHRDSARPFIGNELGLAGCVDIHTHERGWVLPLRQDIALMIYPKVRRRVIAAHGREWITLVEHHTYIPEQAEKMNQTIAQAAQEFIYGPTREALLRRKENFNIPPTPIHVTMGGWPFGVRIRRAHEFDWHRLAGIVTHGLRPGYNEINLQDLDLEALEKDWCPMILFPPPQVPNFRSGLSYEDGYLSLELGPRPFPGDSFFKPVSPAFGTAALSSPPSFSRLRMRLSRDKG